jgi:dipeptidyl aminopeptidase/acylaminoacyl peptidase
MNKRLVGLAAFGLIVSIGLAVTPGASAAFPGANGRLAYQQDGNIYTSRADGTHVRQLTTNGLNGDPAWSADGRRIAYDHRGRIFVMRADGTDKHMVTSLRHSFDPTWSPNGRRIAFVHDTRGVPEQGEIWIVRASGGQPSRLTQDAVPYCGGDIQPAWSPLGGTIAFEKATGTPNFTEGGCDSNAANPVEIVLLRLKTGARHIVTDASDPNFTGDGRGLVFASAEDPDNPGFTFPPQYESSDLTGEPRTFYSRAWCAEGAPCLTDVVAAPTSTVANPQGLYLETLEGSDPGVFGGYCVVSANSVDGVPGTGQVDGGFCRNDGTLIDQLDWQPIAPEVRREAVRLRRRPGGAIRTSR